MFESAYEFEVEGGHDVIDPHRHRYRIRIECVGPLHESGPQRGMVVDFRDLARVARTVVRANLEGVMLTEDATHVDRDRHRDLEVVVVDFRPTVELLAKRCFDQVVATLDEHSAAAIRRVVIWENDHCMAAYGRTHQDVHR